MGPIVVGALSVIILFIIVTALRKLDSKVEDYKLDQDPSNIELLRKAITKDIANGKVSDAMGKYQKIYDLRNTDIESNIVLANFYHNKNDSHKTGVHSRNIVEKLLPTDESINVFLENHDEPDDIETLTFLIGNTIYFYGQIKFQEGNLEAANRYKEWSIKYNPNIHKDNLY